MTDNKKIRSTLSKKVKKTKDSFHTAYNKHTIYMYIVVALVLTFIVEMIAGIAAFDHSKMYGVYFLIGSPYVFICNAFIVMMTLSFTLLLRKRIFWISVISVMWIILGVTNGVLVATRVTPLTASDFRLIDSAFSIMDKYFSVWQIILVVIGVIAALAVLVLLFFRAPKVDHKIKYGRNIVAIVLIWVIGMGAINLGIASGLINKKFGNLRDSYFKYGFAYCFTNSVLNTGIQKPKNYSASSIKKIVDEEESQATEATEKTPNIIFLQLESFFDLNNMTNIKLSDNPVPNFEKIYNECPSGYLTVPVVGAGTVNTEFEIMTGMNLDDFGSGELPFKTVLTNHTSESICYNLKEYGYKCHAIHNNTATFYGRNKVFSNLGYDTFSSIETMNITEFTPTGWAKDKFLKDEILDTLDLTTEQDFIYAISVQGHGAYSVDDSYESKIKVTGLDDESLTREYEYYADQTREMDKFIGSLVKALKKRKEETILVMYGDHLPSLGITAENLKNKNVYQTQYVIWSNFDNDYYKNKKVKAYQLESRILKPLKMTAGVINNYTQFHRKDSDYKENLKNLAYDMLYGDNYASGEENPYVATDLQLGIHPARLTNIQQVYEDDVIDGFFYGENFNTYSKVYINDEEMETDFIDNNTLMVRDCNIKYGDKVVVCQQDADGVILTQTDEFTYSEDEIKPPNYTPPETKKAKATKKSKKSKKSKKNKEAEKTSK